MTIGTLRAWLGRPVTKAEVRILTVADVKAIYHKNYWDAVGGDAMPALVDLAVFDPAVNSGPGRASGMSVAAAPRQCPQSAESAWSSSAPRTPGRPSAKAGSRCVADIRVRHPRGGQTRGRQRRHVGAQGRCAGQGHDRRRYGRPGHTADLATLLIVDFVVFAAFVVPALFPWHRSGPKAVVSASYLTVASDIDA